MSSKNASCRRLDKTMRRLKEEFEKDRARFFARWQLMINGWSKDAFARARQHNQLQVKGRIPPIMDVYARAVQIAEGVGIPDGSDERAALGWLRSQCLKAVAMCTDPRLHFQQASVVCQISARVIGHARAG